MKDFIKNNGILLLVIAALLAALLAVFSAFAAPVSSLSSVAREVPITWEAVP